jgi:hypothetical protein
MLLRLNRVDFRVPKVVSNPVEDPGDIIGSCSILPAAPNLVKRVCNLLYGFHLRITSLSPKLVHLDLFLQAIE